MRNRRRDHLHPTLFQHRPQDVPRHNVKLLIQDGHGRVLVQLRTADAPTSASRWCTMGGTVEPGENPEEAAHRELREEAGFDTPLRTVAEFITPRADGLPTVRSVWHGTTDRDLDQIITSTGEGQIILPVPPSALAKLDLADSARIALATVVPDVIPSLEERKLRGVVFDFGSTLTTTPKPAVLARGRARVAKTLGVSIRVYEQIVDRVRYEWSTGRLGTELDALRHVAFHAAGQPTPEQLLRAAAQWHQAQSRARVFRPGAVELLATLRSRGYRIGLISDTMHHLPTAWHQLPVAPYIDRPIFSVTAGWRKPHLQLYWDVAKRLDLDPGEVLYIGDGASTELAGAVAAGMPAIRLHAPDHDDPSRALVTWPGPEIHQLTEVLTYFP